MIHINLVCVGKIKENYLKDATLEYAKRLSKYCKLKIIEVTEEQIGKYKSYRRKKNFSTIKK